MTTNDTIKALANDALINACYIVRTKTDPFEVEEYVGGMTLGMERIATLQGNQPLVQAINRMRIIHQAALAYATGRTYEVPR